MAWGLEIDTEVLRLCRAEMWRGRLRLRRRAEAAVPAGLIRPSLKDRNLNEPAALTGVLRELCRQAGCRGWVQIALPDPIFSLRTIATDELPAVPEEARRFLRWQARDLLPFPAEEARLDSLPPVTGPDGRPRVICLMARDRVLAEYEQAIQDAGLRVAVLDTSSVSLAQAASTALKPGTIGLLTIGRTRTTLLVVQAGHPRFWRILPDGDQAWVDGQRHRLLREVADSVTFFREAEGLGAVDGLVLNGPGPLMAAVAPALADWLGVQVRPLDLRATLHTEGHAEDLSQWGPALGAAIRPC